jgi:WD40 repeat protein
MRPDDLDHLLRSGAADIAASAGVAGPAAIRRRGDRRRHRVAAVSAVLAFAIGAGGAAAYAGLVRPAGHAPVASGVPATPAGTQTGTAASSPGSRPGIAAVTTAGAVQVLDLGTGKAIRTLTPAQDAIGDEIGVSPGGQTVYFAVRKNCVDDIESVPVSGGSKPVIVAHGALPAVSPDGTELAFVREHQAPSRDGWINFTCPPFGGGTPTVMVLNLSTGKSTSYSSPGEEPISHLSWSPAGRTLLVSAGPGWELATLDVAAGRFTGTVPMTLTAPAGLSSYYREGVYLPSGSLFVDQVCCNGNSNRISSTALTEVNASGAVTHQVAIGLTSRDHTSLAADPGGQWLLYLSGHDLFLSDEGGKAFALTTGLIAAVWL